MARLLNEVSLSSAPNHKTVVLAQAPGARYFHENDNIIGPGKGKVHLAQSYPNASIETVVVEELSGGEWTLVKSVLPNSRIRLRASSLVPLFEYRLLIAGADGKDGIYIDATARASIWPGLGYGQAVLELQAPPQEHPWVVILVDHNGATLACTIFNVAHDAAPVPPSTEADILQRLAGSAGSAVGDTLKNLGQGLAGALLPIALIGGGVLLVLGFALNKGAPGIRAARG